MAISIRRRSTTGRLSSEPSAITASSRRAGYRLDPLATGTEAFEAAARRLLDQALHDADLAGAALTVERT